MTSAVAVVTASEHPLVPGPAAADAGVRARAFVAELESARGIAILLVFAFHVDAYVRLSVASTTPLALAFVRAGHTGVDLFFVLSAFLLSQPFLAEAAGGKRVVVRDYFMRRALRILPLYYTAVVAGTVLSATRPLELRRGIPYLFFLNGFDLHTDMHPYSSIWWSLATEAQFYVLLPLLPLFLRTRRGRLTGVVVLLVYALAYVEVVRGDLHMGSITGQIRLLQSVFGLGPVFLWGILGAAVYRRFGSRVRERLARVAWVRNGGADVAMIALLIANALFLQWVVAIAARRNPGLPWHIVNGGLWATFLLFLLLAPLRMKRVFSNGVLGWLGVLSYSIYIAHSPFMQKGLWAVQHAWPGSCSAWTPGTFAVVAVLAAGCVGFSALTYRFIERPFLARKVRVGS